MVSILENKKKNKGNLFDFLLYSSLSGYTLAQLGEDNVMNCQIDRNVWITQILITENILKNLILSAPNWESRTY